MDIATDRWIDKREYVGFEHHNSNRHFKVHLLVENSIKILK